MIKLFALFPIISMSLLVVNFRKYGLCRRSALLSAAVAWGVILTITTEVLSIVNLFNFKWISIVWVMTIFLLAIKYICMENIMSDEDIYSLTILTKLLLCSVIVIIGTTGITAVIAPPNNWDSMTYHMSRVMHWIQNQSVAHYPTSILRQIELNPWAEYAITNFQILSGGDYLANLVQWFCMVCSIIGVTLIADEFGADRRGQIFAAVFVATIPMGILQSSSTQNDCVVSLWLVCLVYFGIRFNEKPCWFYASTVGTSLGLALLTKGTAYIYAFPLSIWLAIYSLKSFKFTSVKYIILIIITGISLNIGHYTRNYETFGNILSSGEINFCNDLHSLTSLVSNITRNMALEAGSPFYHVNHVIKSGAELLHASMGIDINDNRTTWPSTKFDVVGSRHEDTAGNPLHLLLIIISTFALCCRKTLKHKQNKLSYLFALVMAFTIYCYYLKWNPWTNRLHLPLFILWSPIVALVIADIKQAWATNTILIAIYVTALPVLLLNSSRPLITNSNTTSIFTSQRNSQYFNNRPALMQDYYKIAQHLKNNNCSSVAIQIGIDTWEYPLWILLQEEFSQNIRIEHVNVDNMSGKIPLKNFTYCEMVSIDRGAK